MSSSRDHETPKKAVKERPTKEQSCNDFCRVCRCNFKSFYGDVERRVLTENFTRPFFSRFFRITHDGLSGSGSTRSLLQDQLKETSFFLRSWLILSGCRKEAAVMITWTLEGKIVLENP